MKSLSVRLTAYCLLVSSAAAAAEFQSAWPSHERVWAGAEYWANPMQDWRIANGRLECAVSGGNRNVYLLTHHLSEAAAPFEMSVLLGPLDPGRAAEPGWAGFRVGIRGAVDDYRYAALRGRGLNLGVTASGRVFIGDGEAAEVQRRGGAGLPASGIELRLRAEPSGGAYRLTLAAIDPSSGATLDETVRNGIPAADVAGNLALVNEPMLDGQPSNQNSYGPHGERTGDVRFWFSDWKASGAKLEARPERAFGPVLWSQYTLSRGVMKMSVQMPPLGVADNQTVRLEVQEGGQWKTLGEEHIDTLARTATFRAPDWDSSRDTPYRAVYSLIGPGGEIEDHHWTGTIRRDPVDKRTIEVAAFTGNQDTGFPNARTVRNVGALDPDILVFTGDQIYEMVAGFRIQREPVETAALDYLRKWYLVGWAFGDLMRSRVTVHMPDDHDVYQGNIWGAGGRKISIEEHERGGYVMPAEWVRMVERTQTSHLPGPFDPRPVEQGIGVYYTDLNYGRISFAILEDRKFKSGPKGITPPTGGRPDHITDPDFDRESYDAPEAKLLGDRQLAFLREWAADWRGAVMKASLSQTIFANAATHHGANLMWLEADLDSNGWPQSGRNRALHELRKGFAFMIGGDQHLPTMIHHGIDAFNDAGYSFSVPSIAAGYPRAYEPKTPGRNRAPGAPDYTGEHYDGLGNRMTVYAVANPEKEQRDTPLELLHDKASGFGYVRFDKTTRDISIECYKLLADPGEPGAQFEGWPVTINQLDNYGREAAAHLPVIEVTGMSDPVVQVIDEISGEIVYTVRIGGQSFEPKVFRGWGTYTVRVGEPETERFQEFRGLGTVNPAAGRTLEVIFR